MLTGGAGYVGSLLTPQLLDAGYEVTVYDKMYFGDFFLPKDNPRLKVVAGDIREHGRLLVGYLREVHDLIPDDQPLLGLLDDALLDALLPFPDARFDAALNAANLHLAELYPDGPPKRGRMSAAA